MKNIIIKIVIITFCFGELYAQEMHINGKWRNMSNTRIIEFFKSHDRFSAKALKSDNQKEINQLIIWGLKYDKNAKQWAEGEIRLASMNHSANCYIYLKNDSTAVISGYHGLKILGHSETYYKLTY